MRLLLSPRPALALMMTTALASAGATAEPEKTVYVQNFKVDKSLETDGSVFSSSVCTKLLADKTLDVLCEDDMSASLSHMSQMQLLGTVEREGGNVGLSQRMGMIDVVVHGKVSKGKHGLILNLTVWERDPTFEGEVVKIRRKHGHLRIKGIQGGVAAVFSRLERVIPRLAALAKEQPKGPVPEGDLR